MEMRTILTQLYKNFTFELSDAEKASPTTAPERGGNNGTMGPIDMDYKSEAEAGLGFGGTYGMHCYAVPRHAEGADWQSDLPAYWPKSRGEVPGIVGSSEPAPPAEMAGAAASSDGGAPEDWQELVAAARGKGLQAGLIYPWSAEREAAVRAALA